MSITRRELLKGAAALGAAGAVSQVAPKLGHAQTTQKRELVVAQGGDISKFDPHFSTSSNDIRWSFNVFDNLTARRPDGSLYSGLAEEVKLESQTRWTFKLRHGVKFHNGDPFTSADVKFSLERTYDPNAKTMVATVFTTIDRIEALDPTTLVIHTKKPDPLLPARLAFYGGQMVPKKYVEASGNDTFNAKPVGTGPVRFVSWVKDDKLTVEANSDYFGGKPDFDRLIVRAIPETAPRIAATIRGCAWPAFATKMPEVKSSQRLPKPSSTWKPEAACQRTGSSVDIEEGSSRRSESSSSVVPGAGCAVTIRRYEVSTGGTSTGACAIW